MGKPDVPSSPEDLVGDIITETRKGVALSYALEQVAV
mgnify:FL=1